MVHHSAWSSRLDRSTGMVVSGWCVSFFFIGSEFVELLSRYIFSDVFVLVCLSVAWLDYGGRAFARVVSRLSCYFLGESIWSSKLESISSLYKFCFVIRYITIF